ncbi:hypothetical protein [Nocardia tengchongensis]
MTFVGGEINKQSAKANGPQRAGFGRRHPAVAGQVSAVSGK